MRGADARGADVRGADVRGADARGAGRFAWGRGSKERIRGCGLDERGAAWRCGTLDRMLGCCRTLRRRSALPWLRLLDTPRFCVAPRHVSARLDGRDCGAAAGLVVRCSRMERAGTERRGASASLERTAGLGLGRVAAVGRACCLVCVSRGAVARLGRVCVALGCCVAGRCAMPERCGAAVVDGPDGAVVRCAWVSSRFLAAAMRLGCTRGSLARRLGAGARVWGPRE